MLVVLDLDKTGARKTHHTNDRRLFFSHSAGNFPRQQNNMAFDQPLEADRVDPNFFSTLARAPVVGALLWVLGGNKALEEEEKQRKQQVANAMLASSDAGNGSETEALRIKHPAKMTLSKRVSSLNASELKKSPPSLLGSEISVEECVDTLDGMSLVHHNTSSSQGKLKPDGTAPRKQLSWSDECGKDLVDYGDEVRNDRHSRRHVACIRSINKGQRPRGKHTTGQASVPRSQSWGISARERVGGTTGERDRAETTASSVLLMSNKVTPELFDWHRFIFVSHCCISWMGGERNPFVEDDAICIVIGFLIASLLFSHNFRCCHFVYKSWETNRVSERNLSQCKLHRVAPRCQDRGQ